ncbi:MAG: oligosaccharide flippase family protein [Pirellulaceae bacterium]
MESLSTAILTCNCRRVSSIFRERHCIELKRNQQLQNPDLRTIPPLFLDMSSVPASKKLTSQCDAPQSGLSTESLAFGIAFALILTVVQRGLGGVRGLLFCRLMSDQELGQWSMINCFLMALAPLAVLGLPGSFGKFVEHYYQNGQLKSFLWKISLLCCLSTLGVSGAIVLFPRFFSQQVLGSPEQTTLMYWMAGTLLFLTLSNYLTTLVESMRQIRLVTIMRFVSGTSFTVFGIWLLLAVPMGSYSAMIAFLASCILGTLPAIWYLWKWNRGETQQSALLPSSQLWVRLAPYAFWWWLSNIIHNVFEFADRYMLIHFASDDAEYTQSLVGQYHSGRVIPLLMVGVAAMLSGLLLPYVAKSWADGNIAKARAQLNWTVKLSTLGMMGANVVLLALGPFVFDVLLDGKFNDGLAVFPMTMMYCTWFSIATLSQDFLWVSEKGKIAVLSLGAGLLINILFNALLIPTYGLWGAVIGTSLGTASTLCLLLWANARYGCPPDLGCWAAVIMPMILLLPTSIATVVYIAFVAQAFKTSWIFDREEKRQVVDMLQKAQRKMLRR